MSKNGAKIETKKRERSPIWSIGCAPFEEFGFNQSVAIQKTAIGHGEIIS